MGKDFRDDHLEASARCLAGLLANPRVVFDGVGEGVFDSLVSLSLDLGHQLAVGARRYPLPRAEDPVRRETAEALEVSGWNKTRAARLLGITPRTMFTRVKKYNLVRR